MFQPIQFKNTTIPSVRRLISQSPLSKALIIVSLLSVVAISQAATTLSFEDLYGTGNQYGSGPVPSDYAGLTWNNWVFFDRFFPPWDPSSGQVRLLPQSSPSVKFGQDVTFIGAWLAGRAYDQYLEGYKNGSKMFESAHMANDGSNFGQYLTVNWPGVDEIRLHQGSADQTALDDFQYEIAQVDPDTTPPIFGNCPAAGPFVLNSGSFSIGPITAQDPESGINASASTLTGTITTSSVGPKSVTFTAVNTVGLQATKDCEYQVQYNYAGFFQPIDNGIPNLAKAGQTIPIKWRLTDATGAPISDPSSFVSVTSGATPGGCGGSADAIETYAGSSASGLQYLGNGNWQYNWKTPKSYAGQCRTLSLNLRDDVATRTASFTFN